MSQLELQRPSADASALPAGAWPFDPSAPFAGAIRQLLVATAGLPLTGWEVSCRLSPGRVTVNRLLLGLSPAAVADHRLQTMPKLLGMPERLSRDFLQELPYAKRMLMAAEQGAQVVQGAEFKAYHEFFQPMPDGADLPVALAMRGRKWRGTGHQQSLRCTDYLRLGLPAADLQRWLGERSELGDALGPALAIVERAVDLALDVSPAPLDVLTVTESPSPRLSCCVRFYDRGLRLQALLPAISRLAQVWNFSPAWLARLPRQRRLCWLAVGLDAGSQPFLTLYSESSLADARLAIALGAFDEHS